jgi:phosphoribosylformylglycinamidine cyclo-ligase
VSRRGPLSYRDSGVDQEAARTHTDAIAGMVSAGVTGFAGAFTAPEGDQVLLACTDGVGTKLLLAIELGDVSGLGQDLVAMCVNDLATSGAQPIAFLDYLAVAKLDPAVTSAVVGSIARACEAVGCPLVGGETAELPGLYAPGHFDLAGFAVGAVARREMLGPERVRAGDLIVGVASSGLHSNGYSLVRALVQEGSLAPDPALLLAPTRLYVDDVRRLAAARVEVHSAAHITGGGLPENLPRALPEGLRPALDPDAWDLGAASEAVLATGRVDEDEAWRTFNMGLGMCLILPEHAAEAATGILADATVVGFVEEGEPGIRLLGD